MVMELSDQENVQGFRSLLRNIATLRTSFLIVTGSNFKLYQKCPSLMILHMSRSCDGSAKIPYPLRHHPHHISAPDFLIYSRRLPDEAFPPQTPIVSPTIPLGSGLRLWDEISAQGHFQAGKQRHSQDPRGSPSRLLLLRKLKLEYIT